MKAESPAEEWTEEEYHERKYQERQKEQKDGRFPDTNLSGNVKKNAGFKYIRLNLDYIDPRVLKRVAMERIEFDFQKTHWIAISASCPEVYYKLDLLYDNSGFCTCPDFIYRKSKRGLPCKHLVALDMHIKTDSKVQHKQDIDPMPGGLPDCLKPPTFCNMPTITEFPRKLRLRSNG